MVCAEVLESEKKNVLDGLDERVESATQVLEFLLQNRPQLAEIRPELRMRLMVAAGQLSRPDRGAKRQVAKAMRRKDRKDQKMADEQVLHSTGIRTLRRAPVFQPEQLEHLLLPPPEESGSPELKDARKCYVCKEEYRQIHFFYDAMCPACAEFNWQKRNQTANLKGRVALVTGARVKIGYQASLKLLRAGAHVIATTRFPKDAALRYAREPDFAQWGHRVEVHGLDLRHTPSVEQFTKLMLSTHDRLDFIINNACQTVRRPAGFYAHMMELEQAHEGELEKPARALLANPQGHALAKDVLPDSAALSQVALLPEDLEKGSHIFPEGHLDADLQQIDLRTMNTWRMSLAQVPTIEMLEVYLVNAVAPFVLNARLKPLMTRYPSKDKHIVNVSAMEGQFYRSFKTDKHPHTNMAKAALNMMTRTSAVDYVKDGIHMNSVDTGWITDEDPVILAARKTEMHGFHPPLDAVDGAARIIDPILDGINTGNHVWGQFIKDYKPTPW